MSELLIREIAQQIINEQLLLNWKFYAVLGGLIVITAVTSAYLSAYFSKRAEIRAINNDLKDVLKQLKLTTQAAKEVETAISHTDWVSKEWIVLRRNKLEELLEAIYESSDWIDDETNHRIFRSDKAPKSPLSKIKRISYLYFPELNKEIKTLETVLRDYKVFIINTQKELLEARNSPELTQQALSKFMPGMEPLHSGLIDAISMIEAKAPSLLNNIMGEYK